MIRFSWMFALALLVAGCQDRDHDTKAPAAPRGLFSVTGDKQVHLTWLGNTESDLAGYKVYVGSCAGGSGCPYDLVSATTGTSMSVSALVNGQTRFFAVSAYDRVGNESDLSYESVYDTPRPEGFNLVLTNSVTAPAASGYDFSANVVRSSDDLNTDLYFGSEGGRFTMFAPFTDTQVQDAGYATTLDAVDFAPLEGWSPTGTVELIPGHCYVVLTTDDDQDHYAKFRVNRVNATEVSIDWAYQTSPNNRELKARPSTTPERIRRDFRARS